MHVWHIGRSLRHALGDFRLPPFQLLHARLHDWLIHAVLDGGENAGDAPVDLVQLPPIGLVLRPPLPIEPGRLLHIGPHRRSDGLRRHHPVREAREDPLLDPLAPDGPVVGAGASAMVVQAAEAVTHDEPIATTAAPAGEKARKQGHGPPGRMQPLRAGLPHTDGGRLEQPGNVLLAAPRRLPEHVIDDAQMRHHGPDPLALRVRARDAPAGRRLLDEALPVPDQDAGIEFIVEDAGAARHVAKQAKAALQAAELAAVADRGYFNSPEILECAEAGITVTLPKPMTSGAKSQGRFGKQDFVYVPDKDVYRCPAGEQLTYRFSAEEHGKTIRRYWTTACPKCPLQSRCTTGPERRIPRWEHEHLLEAVQERLDASPEAMRMRRARPSSIHSAR